MPKTSAEFLLYAAALVVAFTTVGGALLWLIKPRIAEWIRGMFVEQLGDVRAKVDETHKQVTENHHSNEHPTVLDRIDDVHQLALNSLTQVNRALAKVDKVDERCQGLDTTLNDHLILSTRSQADMWRAIEAVAKSSPPDLSDLDDGPIEPRSEK